MQRTRAAVLGAFVGLVTRRRYEEITVEDIVKRSGVGRSTLYEHFASKDEILKVSLKGGFSILADAMLPADNTPRLVGLLEHFWSNRALGNAIFSGSTRNKTVSVLVDLLEQRLTPKRARRGGALIIPTRLAATQMAEALLALVFAWLAGQSRCSAPTLAQALRKTAAAMADALLGN